MGKTKVWSQYEDRRLPGVGREAERELLQREQEWWRHVIRFVETHRTYDPE